MLSGGMAKGAYQVGALKAIAEIFDPDDFDCVSTASIGTLNGYAYLNRILPEAEKMWLSISANTDVRWIMKTMRSSFVDQITSSIVVSDQINKSFYVPLLEFNQRRLVYQDFSKIDAGQIKDYLMASVAMPFYSSGVKIGTHRYFDGAMVDNIPVFPLVDRDLDYILCIYFDNYNYMFENKEFSKKIIKLTFPDNTFISNSIILSENRTQYMLQEGYQRTKNILETIFRNGTEDLECIQKKMSEFEFKNREQKTRITGDFLVSNINKVAQKIARKVTL